MSKLMNCVLMPLLIATTLTTHLLRNTNVATPAILTLNSFEQGGDGGGPSKCDGRYHSNNAKVVALSTRWYNQVSRCEKHIIVNGNGQSTTAKVVDECDSNDGCHANIVDASKAVWAALGLSPSNPIYGEMQITWSDV